MIPKKDKLAKLRSQPQAIAPISRASKLALGGSIVVPGLKASHAYDEKKFKADEKVKRKVNAKAKVLRKAKIASNPKRSADVGLGIDMMYSQPTIRKPKKTNDQA